MNYVLNGETKQRAILPTILSAITTIIIITISVITLNLPAVSAKAIDTILCGTETLGANTTPASTELTFNNDYQKQSIQNLYSNVIKWTTYNGTPTPNKPSQTFNSTDKDKQKIVEKETFTNVARVNHNGSSCVNRNTATNVANAILWAANAISRVSSAFISLAVNPNFICQNDNPKNQNCINLIKVVAGSKQAGDDGGIIGRLYTGLYKGLAVIAFLIVGLWVAWQGIAKRKLITALKGLIGSILIFGAGILFMGNPLLIAQLPMRIGTGLGGCIVMGINGQNCFDMNTTTRIKQNEHTECYVDTTKETTWIEASSIQAQQAQCIIWKAFILEPWTIGQFGYSYEQLNTDTSPIINNNKQLEYWKNIKTGTYSNTNQHHTCNTEQYSYSNIALYQLDLMSNKHNCGTKYHSGERITIDYDKNEQPEYGEVYTDWAYLIDAITTNNNWKTWAGYNSATRIGVATTALAAILLSTLPTLTMAVLSMVYLFISILLTAFAPLFILIGIIPGQGREIFKGWLSRIAENTLRYLVTLMLILISTLLYGGVLSINPPTPTIALGGKFTFVILTTLFIGYYYKPIIDMMTIRKGTWFSNAINEKMQPMLKRLKLNTANTAATTTLGFIAAPTSKTNTIMQNTANRINFAKRMYEYSKLENLTVIPQTSISRQITRIKTKRTAKTMKQTDWITQQLREKTKQNIITTAAKNGFTIEQMEQLLQTNPVQARAIVTQHHENNIKQIIAASVPINNALAAIQQQKQNIDTLVKAAANNNANAVQTIANSYTNGDLTQDLNAWLAYRNAAIAVRTTKGDTTRLQAIMTENKEAYQRIINWSTSAKNAIDKRNIQQWNASHPTQTATTINDMKAISNQYRHQISEEEKQQKKEETILTNIHRIQKSNELIRTIDQLNANKMYYSTSDSETIENIYNAINSNRNWDPLKLPTINKSLNQKVAEITKETTPFSIDMLKPQIELQKQTKETTAKPVPLTVVAKKIGIRTRTLARLQAQGLTEAEIRRAMKQALKQYPHVSKDQALNQYLNDK